jgi:hypothetical protein
MSTEPHKQPLSEEDLLRLISKSIFTSMLTSRLTGIARHEMDQAYTFGAQNRPKAARGFDNAIPVKPIGIPALPEPNK